MEEDEDLEALRRKKILEAYKEAQARAEQEERLRAALASMLEPAAYERLMLVKMSSPSTFAKAVQVLAYLQQSGQLKERLNEAQLKKLLEKMVGEKPEPTITIKRKGE